MNFGVHGCKPIEWRENCSRPVDIDKMTQKQPQPLEACLETLDVYFQVSPSFPFLHSTASIQRYVSTTNFAVLTIPQSKNGYSNRLRSPQRQQFPFRLNPEPTTQKHI